MEHDEIEALLRDKTGEAIALKGVAARVKLCGLLGEVEVEQRYLNSKNINIEAVYTFPLPIGAVLLALEVELDGRTLSGEIVEKQQAEAAYEEAITDGDSAVMLQYAGPGLYTMNLGNLKAGESCVIRYRYGMALQWQAEHLRLLLPTTIAPRYGNPSPLEMQPHQVPVTSSTVSYPFSIDIEAEGLLAQAEVTSPTHTLAVAAREGKLHIALAQLGAMDRDFVLLFKSAQSDSCLLVRDDDKFIALAAIRVPMLARKQALTLRMNVVIDCSGSMAGTSIIQARKAALEMLSQLRPGDQFNVTLFGSDHRHLFRHLTPVTPANIAKAAEELIDLQADMGGTETGGALDACYRMAKRDANEPGGDTLQDSILLITDGQIHDYSSLLTKAKKSGQRLFSVGVGTVVAEGFVREIAECTGGAFELVSPQEGMAEVILKQFHRLRQPKIEAVKLEWAEPPLWQTPLPTAVYAGDTILVWAAFAREPWGCVHLHFTLDGEHATSVMPQMVERPNLARMAIAHHIEQLTEESEKLALALEYQLLTSATNFLVVAEREAKTETLPLLQQVPQMAPAGWGGAKLSKKRASLSASGATRARDMMEAAKEMHGVSSAPMFASAVAAPAGSVMLAEMASAFDRAPEQATSYFLDHLRKELGNALDAKKLPGTLMKLEELGLPQEICASLREIMDKSGALEQQVVIAFLFVLSTGALQSYLGPALKRLILLGKKRSLPDEAMLATIQTALAGADQREWNWSLTVA